MLSTSTKRGSQNRTVHPFHESILRDGRVDQSEFRLAFDDRERIGVGVKRLQLDVPAKRLDVEEADRAEVHSNAGWKAVDQAFAFGRLKRLLAESTKRIGWHDVQLEFTFIGDAIAMDNSFASGRLNRLTDQLAFLR